MSYPDYLTAPGALVPGTRRKRFILPPTHVSKIALTSLEAGFHLIISQKPHYFKFLRSMPQHILKLTENKIKFIKMKKDVTKKINDDVATIATQEAQAKPKKSKRNRMKHSRIPAEDFRRIMETNAHFYSAFSSLDLAAMENLWLDDKRCICHFPGMKKLVSYDKIMKSWKHAVDEMDGAIRRNWMEPSEIQIEFQTSEKATVFCKESLYTISCSVVAGELRPESELIQTLSATNAFKKENGKWHLWYHQASSMNDNPADLRVHRKTSNTAPTATQNSTSLATESSLTMQTFEQQANDSTNTSDPFRALDTLVRGH